VAQNFVEDDPLQKLRPSPHSSDIARSDFNRFGKVNNALIGQEISDEIDLLEVVSKNLSGISHDELQAVFRSWVERVQPVIHANADSLSE
jgi:hypothetical protein